jgi:predicted enzyme related to lactoylglutathione lyase
MKDVAAQFAGIELYFSDLERAKEFYSGALGLRLSDERAGHHAKFESGAGFVCLEVRGSESYPSLDKAVLFFEVADLEAALAALGRDRVIGSGERWAVLRDPEGHTILLFQTPTARRE